MSQQIPDSWGPDGPPGWRAKLHLVTVWADRLFYTFVSPVLFCFGLVRWWGGTDPGLALLFMAGALLCGDAARDAWRR